MIYIALVGDYNPSKPAHQAIPKMLALCAAETGSPVDYRWLRTEKLVTGVEGTLHDFAGVWCVPGSPYQSMDGALNAIRFARERDLPFLGTCGGFQHAVIEFARDVMGITDAAHAEVSPDATTPLISPLSCSIVGRQGTLRIQPGSKLSQICGAEIAEEAYNCRYGINPEFRDQIEASALKPSAFDAETGEIRAVELDGHPFFIGALFQPELAALENRMHPIVREFVMTSASGAKQS